MEYFKCPKIQYEGADSKTLLPLNITMQIHSLVVKK